MTLSTVFLIYTGFYALAVLFAYVRVRKGTAPKPRNSLAAMLIGGFGTVLIYISSVMAPGGTVPLVLVAAMALFPAFLLGLGNLVGLGIATWHARPAARFALGGLAVGLPLLVSGAMAFGPNLSGTEAASQTPQDHAPGIATE